MSGRDFARALGNALQAAEHELPRGAVPQSAAAELLQWRGVAAAIGELHRGPTWAVSYEGDAPLRSSPGYRHVSVYDCPSRAALLERLQPLGRHLKALGAAGGAARRELATLAPYVCAVGAMQTPPLDAPLDGLPALAGSRAERKRIRTPSLNADEQAVGEVALEVAVEDLRAPPISMSYSTRLNSNCASSLSYIV